MQAVCVLYTRHLTDESIIPRTTNLYGIICSVVFLTGCWLQNSDFVGKRHQFRRPTDFGQRSVSYTQVMLIELVAVSAKTIYFCHNTFKVKLPDIFCKMWCSTLITYFALTCAANQAV